MLQDKETLQRLKELNYPCVEKSLQFEAIIEWLYEKHNCIIKFANSRARIFMLAFWDEPDFMGTFSSSSYYGRKEWALEQAIISAIHSIWCTYGENSSSK